jgi:esterase/lipase
VADIPLSARHFPSGLNSGFIGGDGDFANYIELMKSRIQQSRDQLGIANSAKIIDGNSPFQLKPQDFKVGRNHSYQRGILLIHGLSDSPYFMRTLGDFFAAQGFRVMAILLPGHGTQAGDLLTIKTEAWEAAVAYGCQQLAQEVDEIYLGGFSAGGALSVLQSLKDERVRGLFLFAPALKISAKARFARLYHLIDWLLPRAKWLNLHHDEDHYKYESFSKNAVTQMWRLTQKVRQQLSTKPLTIPIFAVASAEDATVDASAIAAFMEACPHPTNHLVWYDAAGKPPAAHLGSKQIDVVTTALPASGILGSAHTALVLADDNPEYGFKGCYVNCLHYFPHDITRFQACKSNPPNLQRGEITVQNLQVDLLARLMVNPHFPALKISLQRFIENLP